jgi:hypothetical protein
LHRWIIQLYILCILYIYICMYSFWLERCSPSMVQNKHATDWKDEEPITPYTLSNRRSRSERCSQRGGLQNAKNRRGNCPGKLGWNIWVHLNQLSRDSACKSNLENLSTCR